MTDGGGFAAFIGGMRPDPDEGVTLEQALRGRGSSSWYEREPEPRDNDEQMANLLARGYQPGSASQLAQRYGDTLAELETERDKVQASQRRQERIRRDHDAGKITVFDIMRMQDTDEGDPHRVEVLEQRAASLRQQVEEVQRIVSRQPAGPADPIEAASRHAQRMLAELARPAAPARPVSQRSVSLPKAAAGQCVCGDPYCDAYPDGERARAGQDCGCAAGDGCADCDAHHADAERRRGPAAWSPGWAARSWASDERAGGRRRRPGRDGGGGHAVGGDLGAGPGNGWPHSGCPGCGAGSGRPGGMSVSASTARR